MRRASRQASLAWSMPPNRARAARAASSADNPAARFLRVSVAMWNRSSSSSSRSTRRHTTSARRRRKRSLQFISGLLQDAANGGGPPGPMFGFKLELFAAGSRQAVEARAAAFLGDTPFRFDPALVLQAVKSRIEGALVHLQGVLR